MKQEFRMFKYFVAVLLLLTIFATGYFSYLQYSRNKSELIIQVSDVFNKIALPYRLAKLRSLPRDTELYIPIRTVRLKDITNNYGDPRSGDRSHEGIDIFAPKRTPVFSATNGYITRVGTNSLGGNVVWITGPGGARYYYAHLDSFADGITSGKEVTKDTVLGFVGNTGNAASTPPHLHFGMYFRGAENPYSLFVER